MRGRGITGALTADQHFEQAGCHRLMQTGGTKSELSQYAIGASRLASRGDATCIASSFAATARRPGRPLVDAPLSALCHARLWTAGMHNRLHRLRTVSVLVSLSCGLVSAAASAPRADQPHAPAGVAAGERQLVWTKKTPLPDPGCYQAVVVNGVVYVARHEGQKAYLLTHDPVADAWSARIPLLLEKPKDGEIAVLNGRIYYRGGRERDDRRSLTMEEYDPSTARSRILNGPERDAIRAALAPELGGEFPSRAETWYWGTYRIGERRFVLSSVRGSGVVHVCELLPGSDQLERRTTMPRPRIDSAVVTADGKLYFFGGWTSGSAVSDLIDSYDHRDRLEGVLRPASQVPVRFRRAADRCASRPDFPRLLRRRPLATAE
jgi:hypothetical protein